MPDISILSASEDGIHRMRIDEDSQPYRLGFERDRDRILYSKGFRRLSGKTQVFISGFDDHVRTRLTHTLEVAQIAKSIARNLGLNIPLTEAIALGHDIGHTPFGHSGERTLNYILNSCNYIEGFSFEPRGNEGEMGFKHNLQGIRVAHDLERISPEYNGLNLSTYTLWGIAHHSKMYFKECSFFTNNPQQVTMKKTGERRIVHPCMIGRKENQFCGTEGKLYLCFYDRYLDLLPKNAVTIEALIVALSDEIAQRHHDAEDGYISGLLPAQEIIEKIEHIFRSLWRATDTKNLEQLNANKGKPEIFVSLLSRIIVNFYVTHLIDNVRKNIENITTSLSVRSSADWKVYKSGTEFDLTAITAAIQYSPEVQSADEEFQQFLYNRIINSHQAQLMDGKSDYIIRQLFKAYLTNPQQLPDKTIFALLKNISEQDCALVDAAAIPDSAGLARDVLNNIHCRSNEPCYRIAVLRTVCDYVSGMTDDYAIRCFNLLYAGTKDLRL